MIERLPAHVEAASFIRRAQTAGGFAAVLRKGDPDRGALTLIVRERGELRGFLERELGPDFTYGWSFKPLDASAPPDSVANRFGLTLRPAGGRQGSRTRERGAFPVRSKPAEMPRETGNHRRR